MNKNKILWLILDLIFVIAFNIIFFVAGGAERGTASWLAYFFIHFAYLMLVITPLFVKKSANTAVLGFLLYYLSSAYFSITFIICVILIFINPESYKSCLIINVIITGVYGAMLVSHMLANESTAESAAHHEQELNYVRSSAALIRSIMNNGNLKSDKDLYKRLERLYDLLHSSPVKSSSGVKEYERNVIKLALELENLIINNNLNNTGDVDTLINKITQNAEARNRMLKYGA